MSPLTLCLAAILLLRGVSGIPIKFVADPPRSPLGECEGDCDIDGHCADGLTCHQRERNEEVPGCTGGGSDGSRTDYCIRSDDVVDSSTTASPTAQPSNVPTPLPTTANPTARPTPLPTTAEPTPLPTTANPTNLPTSLPTTASPTPLPSTAKPTPLDMISLPTTTEPAPLSTSGQPTPLPTTTTDSSTPLPLPTAANIQSPTPPVPLPTTAKPTAKPTTENGEAIQGEGSEAEAQDLSDDEEGGGGPDSNSTLATSTNQEVSTTSTESIDGDYPTTTAPNSTSIAVQKNIEAVKKEEGIKSSGRTAAIAAAGIISLVTFGSILFVTVGLFIQAKESKRAAAKAAAAANSDIA